MKSLNKIYELYLQSSQKICIDSRSKNIKNSIFFGIRGEHFDGNLFAEEALKNGASFAIVENINSSNKHIITVDDTLKTLQELATLHRKNISIPIIAITGTNGKTTTKELAHHLLASTFSICSTNGNFNNHIGVPLTILSFKKEHQIGIVELGANHPGEIEFLSQIAQPTHGIITNIGKAHLEGFKNFENIIKTKNELYKYLIQHGGLIFVNENDELLINLTQKYPNKQLYKCEEYQNHDGGNSIIYFECTPFIKLIYNKKEIHTKIIGEYNVNNIVAAIKIAKHFQISNEQIMSVLSRFELKNNRSELVKTQYNQIILDAYNANPTSTSLAIDNFIKVRKLKSNAQSIIILGDMMELGHESQKYHQDIINLLIEKNIQNCYLIGPLFKQTQYPSYFTHSNCVIDCKKIIRKRNIKNALILIKGSRAIKLEKLVEDL